jgi:hypothetical protein
VDGTTYFTYNDPAWIAARHRLGAEAQQAVNALSFAMAAIARQATSAQ